jgi:apolipoprotein D and lipocalin family protein
LSRYTGLWYELAHLPNKYQEGCQNSTTTFSQRNDGEIDILNSCRDKHDGSLHHANGRGWVIDKQHNARLKFSFIWPFRSEYLIIDQGKEYEYSVICSPDRKRLWVISRTPTVSSDILEGIIQNLEKQGFNRDNLVKTDHGGPPTPQVKLIENGTKNNSENK